MTLSYFGVNAINRHPLFYCHSGMMGRILPLPARKSQRISTVRQRHFLRRFNHHRAKLGHAVIGNT